MSEEIARRRSRVLDWSDKAAQPDWYGQTVDEVAAHHPALDAVSTPLLTLDRAAMNENSAEMAAWCKTANVSHAPHGKTTMSPELWKEQLQAGCWGITVANEPQLRVARGAGVPRIIVANLFLRSAGLAWLSNELDSDSTFEFFSWVDSVEAVEIMDAALAEARARRPIQVLIEVGMHGARTGVRSSDAFQAIADAVVASSHLQLAGVAGFEGAVAHSITNEAIARVDEFLSTIVEFHRLIADQYEVAEPILTAGGSVYFDRVAAILGPETLGRQSALVRVVVRSGAYLVHDDGYYRASTPKARHAGPTFRSAMHVWARVISMPEPGIAFLDAGKRDLPVDVGLPTVQCARRLSSTGTLTFDLLDHEVTDTNDQHTFVRVPESSPLRINDIVRLGLSHPCTAFDKWSLIPIIDNASAASPKIVNFVRTYF